VQKYSAGIFVRAGKGDLLPEPARTGKRRGCSTMSVMKKVYETTRPEETFRTGKELGESAAAGEVYALVGDLGVGKTVFTKGFAEGLGIDEPVNSPTFTILQIYEDGRIPLYHFDVYRIEEPEEMEEIGFDEYIDGDGVCLIEWAGRI
jgi:tRNA threonylcarbamoyladenosine biosynthesis protein TsaE